MPTPQMPAEPVTIAGVYLGTSRRTLLGRYRPNGMAARSRGKYVLSPNALTFATAASHSLDVPLASIQKIQFVSMYSGQLILDMPIVKVIWRQHDLSLSSGFVFGESAEDALQFEHALSCALDRFQ